MKVKLLAGVILSVVALFASQNVQSQCKGWTWPEDKATAQEKNVLYSDAVKMKNYRAAVEPWTWLIQNAPKLNSSIYVNGAKIYNGLAKAEKDPVRKAELVDSLLMLHDMRIAACGQEEKVFPRKTFYNYVYNIKNKEKTAEIFEMYEKAFELAGKNLDRGNAQAYVTVLKVYQLRTKSLTDEQILDKYDRLIEVIDHQVTKKKDVEKWESIRAKADDMLPELITIDCDFVRNNWGPKFKEDPTDMKIVERIFGFMLKGKCTDDPLWLEAGKVKQANKPSYSLAKILGSKTKAEGDKATAETYFNEALGLADTGEDKADIYMQLGHLKSESGAKSSARSLYRQAIAADGSSVDGYKYIGKLYFGSSDECSQKTDRVKDRLIYIAAYNQFKRAGNAQLMASAQAQFPSKEEMFERNYNKGDVMDTGCWIGESVTLDTRD
jgi:tetratricopeptide (TPR) repeat protein